MTVNDWGPLREVSLRCGHTNQFQPTPYTGDEVFCRTCNDYSLVIDGLVRGSRRNTVLTVECQSCSFVRKADSMEYAIRKADQHSLKCDHVVKILSPSGNTRKTITPIVTNPLPETSGEPSEIGLTSN